MKIGVTGGSGFVGTHLANQLNLEGHDVYVIDMKEPSLEGVTWLKANLLDVETLTKSFEGLDVVYHLAAIADASLAYKNYSSTFDINVVGTLNVLEAARLSNLVKIIYASTIWVYNASELTEVDESTELTTDTKHVYTTTKLFGEFLCNDYKNMYDLNFTILRFGIPYGPGSEFNVIPIFIKKALNSEALTIRGSGEQKRQFLFVKDLAEGCVSALSEEANNNIFNLVGEKMISVKEIAETISDLIPNTEVEFIEERDGELGFKLVSGTKSKEVLGWSPKTDFSTGIQTTIKWYKNKIK